MNEEATVNLSSLRTTSLIRNVDKLFGAAAGI